MKRLVLGALFAIHCTSGSDQSMRNKDIFDEAAQLNYPAFTSSTISFSGNINGLLTEATNGINAQTPSGTTDVAYAGSFATIEGIVTIPSDYGFGMGTAGCTATNKVFARSFVLQDNSSAVLVAYGLEPPSQNTADVNRMTYITNARKNNMAVFGDRMRITVTRIQNYGSGGNVIPVVTDFSNLVVVSSRNSVSFSSQSTAFVRANDLYRVRRIEGYVKTSPSNKECVSGDAREFQFDYQTGYMGVLCVGASSAAEAESCTGGGKIELNFQLSKNVGAGTLSGFDTGDSFSYNIAKGAKVRLTGPIFPPRYTQPDTNLSLMVGQRIQAETLK